MSSFRYGLKLPTGFAFEGDMCFVEADVAIEQDQLLQVFRALCLTFIDNWEGGNVSIDQDLPVQINGKSFLGTIVDMNQYGQLIIQLNGHNSPSAALALGIEESPSQYFYVRTRKPQFTGDPVVTEQGVLVHDSKPTVDDPIHGNHADAVVAFSYLMAKL